MDVVCGSRSWYYAACRLPAVFRATFRPCTPCRGGGLPACDMTPWHYAFTSRCAPRFPIKPTFNMPSCRATPTTIPPLTLPATTYHHSPPPFPYLALSRVLPRFPTAARLTPFPNLCHLSAYSWLYTLLSGGRWAAERPSPFSATLWTEGGTT